ncbi:F-box/kelch-repeat protein At3g06240-like [Rutidosis leptorrhynchoides]|uniref:F-box/kelch-repeat protein At3g06240-like n=1 Tax=Rutidosis leptorrhynchoides TaxID=125765 RepID=UPI003A991682
MMIGSCNGLVCISPFVDELLVTNPSTREVRKLPMLPFCRGNLCWGFGYDSITDDYKVVAGINESEHLMRFQVLSLKSSQWKFVGDGNYLTYNAQGCFPRPGVLHDGALHWFMYDTKKKKKKKKKMVILSFDLSLEKFKEIPQPDDTIYLCDHLNVLGTFQKYLCVFRTYDILTDHCNTWLMKNYNCWQLIPCDDYEGNKYGAAATVYILDFIPENTWHLCDDDDKGYVDMLWQRWYHIGTPIFVKSLASLGNKRKRKLR